jgi:hypothetical protein
MFIKIQLVLKGIFNPVCPLVSHSFLVGPN